MFNQYLMPGESPMYSYPGATMNRASHHPTLLGGKNEKIDTERMESGTLLITDRRLLSVNPRLDRGSFGGRTLPWFEVIIDQGLAIKEIEARRPYLLSVEERSSLLRKSNREYSRLLHLRLLTGASRLDEERGRLMGFSLGTRETGFWFSTQEQIIWSGKPETKPSGVRAAVMKGKGLWTPADRQYTVEFKADPSVYTTLIAYLVARLSVGPNMAADVWAYAGDPNAKPQALPPLPPPPSPVAPVGTSTEGSRYCTVCGAANSRTSAFCQKCGKPLTPPP